MSFAGGNTGLMLVAFLVAFNVPLAVYWLFFRGNDEDDDTDERETDPEAEEAS